MALDERRAREEELLDARRHRRITTAVHDEGGRICLQVLHAGRYGYHPLIVAPSAQRAPTSRTAMPSAIARWPQGSPTQ